jgi:hypothetical protein
VGFVAAHLPLTTRVVWLAPLGYFQAEGARASMWRSTWRLRAHAHAVFERAAHGVRWPSGAERERWLFVDASAMLAAIEPFGGNADGRHFQMAVNMAWASAILNVLLLDAGARSCSARARALVTRANYLHGEGP